jgi:hypothetical protein
MGITTAGLELAFNATFVNLFDVNSNFLGRGFYIHFYNDIPFNNSNKVVLPTLSSNQSAPQPLTFGSNAIFNQSGQRRILSLNNDGLIYKVTQSTSFRYISLQHTNSPSDFNSIWYIELDTIRNLQANDEFMIPVNAIMLILDANL